MLNRVSIPSGFSTVVIFGAPVPAASETTFSSSLMAKKPSSFASGKKSLGSKLPPAKLPRLPEATPCFADRPEGTRFGDAMPPTLSEGAVASNASGAGALMRAKSSPRFGWNPSARNAASCSISVAWPARVIRSSATSCTRAETMRGSCCSVAPWIDETPVVGACAPNSMRETGRSTSPASGRAGAMRTVWPPRDGQRRHFFDGGSFCVATL